jgi:hypothetical protein
MHLDINSTTLHNFHSTKADKLSGNLRQAQVRVFMTLIASITVIFLASLAAVWINDHTAFGGELEEAKIEIK